MSVIGFTLFGLKVFHEKAVKSGWVLLLLGLCALYVPFALLMWLLAGFTLSLPFFWYPVLIGLHGVSPVQQFPEFWSVALGVLWVAVASWLVIYLDALHRPARMPVSPG
jgi:hypothetical protein